MIKTVIFDIDNTLYSYTDTNKPALLALADYVEKNIGIPREEFRRLYVEASDDLRTYLADTAAVHNRCIRYVNILEMAGKPIHYALPMYETYWGTLMKLSKLSDGALEAIKYLKEDLGLRIGIGTDMTGRMQLIKLENLGILPYVDFMVCSESVGAEKPSPLFFERIVKKSLCKPGECLFIGDHPVKDVGGAESVGMNALWYHPEETSAEEVPAGQTLHSFYDLIGSDLFK